MLIKDAKDFVPNNIDVDIDDNDYLQFKTIQEADAWGKAVYGKYGEEYKGISALLRKHAERTRTNWYKISADSIGMYCGNEFKQINSLMRGISNENADYNIKINNILFSMYRTPVLEQKMILYRVVSQKIISEIMERDKEKFDFLENGFMSTALSYECIKNIEEPCMLKIYLNYYGCKNVYGLYVNEYTNKRDETELLLMPGLYIRLLDKPYMDQIIGKWVYKVTVFHF